MPRRPRLEVSGATYHVTARGNGGLPIFEDDFDRIHLLDQLARAIDRCRWRCLAYCLMGNHYHLLVRTPEPNLSSGMRLIQTRYAKHFNPRHGRQGHLFGDRFHDARVDQEERFLSAAVYTVLNPVRAGIVNRPEEWLWSSYRTTAGLDEAPGFVDVDGILGLLSPDRERAQVLYREMVLETARRG
jgi:putative transposase